MRKTVWNNIHTTFLTIVGRVLITRFVGVVDTAALGGGQGWKWQWRFAIGGWGAQVSFKPCGALSLNNYPFQSQAQYEVAPPKS